MERGQGEACYYLPSLHPSISPASLPNTRIYTDSSNFSEAWNNPSFSSFHSGGKPMDLNCITGRSERSRGASKLQEGKPETDFWFYGKGDHPSADSLDLICLLFGFPFSLPFISLLWFCFPQAARPFNNNCKWDYNLIIWWFQENQQSEKQNKKTEMYKLWETGHIYLFKKFCKMFWLNQ